MLSLAPLPASSIFFGTQWISTSEFAAKRTGAKEVMAMKMPNILKIDFILIWIRIRLMNWFLYHH